MSNDLKKRGSDVDGMGGRKQSLDGISVLLVFVGILILLFESSLNMRIAGFVLMIIGIAKQATAWS